MVIEIFGFSIIFLGGNLLIINISEKTIKIACYFRNKFQGMEIEKFSPPIIPQSYFLHT